MCTVNEKEQNVDVFRNWKYDFRKTNKHVRFLLCSIKLQKDLLIINLTFDAVYESYISDYLMSIKASDGVNMIC